MKKPPGETGAVVAGGAAAAATVTPVSTASDAGIEDRPGVKAVLVDVNSGAAPCEAPISKADTAGGGGPHQQPGGAFIHCVTYAVATEVAVHGDTAVMVIVSVMVTGGGQFWAWTMVLGASTM